MPEISEVRLTSEWVTRKNKDRKIVDVEYLPSNKLKLIEEIDVVGRTLSAQSRGKEMKLWFDDEPVVVTLGMAGSFKNFKERGTNEDINWRHSHIRFRMDDGEWFTWNDIRRFGKSLRKDWNPERGPDIFDEEPEFKRNIFENINHRDFTKPAHEVLMNQKWFNGIGNYLRAEILGKWNVNPFQPINDVISEDFLNHLIEQVHISYQLGGGELYTWMNEDGIPPHDTQEWDTFIQYYGKSEKVKDKQKRTFWFDEKWL
jgi:endonuclease VIII-like 1